MLSYKYNKPIFLHMKKFRNILQEKVPEKQTAHECN